MNIKNPIKKIVAREILIFFSILLITVLIFLSPLILRVYFEIKKNQSLDALRNDATIPDAILDSILIANKVQNLTHLAMPDTNKGMQAEYNPEATIKFYYWSKQSNIEDIVQKRSGQFFYLSLILLYPVRGIILLMIWAIKWSIKTLRE